MAIRYKAWVLALLCGVLATPAMASDEGAYVSLSLGNSNVINGCQAAPLVGTGCSDKTGFSYRATYGYQYTPTWALEASYGKLGSASGGGYLLLALGLSVTATATLHLGDTLAVYVKGGFVRAELKESGTYYSSSSMNRPIIGAGIEYSVTPQFAIRLQGDHFGIYDLGHGGPKIQLLANSIVFVEKY